MGISDLIGEPGDRGGCGCIAAILLAPALYLTIGIGQLFHDAKEEFKGFPRLEQGYAVSEFYIQTRGDVTLVERLPDKDYLEISGGSALCKPFWEMSAAEDEVVICGEFRYKIEADLSVAYSASPDAWDPYSSVRHGYVRLKKLDE